MKFGFNAATSEAAAARIEHANRFVSNVWLVLCGILFAIHELQLRVAAPPPQQRSRSTIVTRSSTKA
jgi:hypothetical protein